MRGNIRHLSKWFFADALFTLDGGGNADYYSSE